MTIKLTNGVELNPITAIGGNKIVQGESRDTLFFVFPEETSLDELDALFSAVNCETITVVEGETEYIHSGYTVRAELKRSPEVVTPATDTEAEVIENRVTVSMSQRTYTENQIAEMQKELIAAKEECVSCDELAAAYTEGVNSIDE